MLNIAIFGGAFNPIHWGHLLMAETAFDQFNLDQVIWVPTFRPPHKPQSLLAFEHRLEMVRQAIAEHPAFTVSEVDWQRQGTSYAIDTLHDLQALNSNVRWHWIVGFDAFHSLPQWYASQELAAQCVWLVAPRGGQKADFGVSAQSNEGRRQEAEVGSGEWGLGSGNQENLLLTTHNPQPTTSQTQNSKLSSNAARSATQNSDSPPPPSLLTPHSSPLTLQWHWLQMPSIALSSSLIRERCRVGRSIRYWVPEPVRCYISAQNLYE